MRRLALVALLVAVACEGSPVGQSPTARTTTRPASVSPSWTDAVPFAGGRILFVNIRGVQWAYPDGSTSVVAGGFLGAEPTASRSMLLAWKIVLENDDYYVMGLDGSHRVHVAGPGPQRAIWGVEVAPAGTKVAYVRSIYLGPGRSREELFVLNLASGARTDLGRVVPRTFLVSPGIVWKTDSEILLFQARGSRSIDGVNVETGDQGTYLRVGDPSLVSAYGRAWPDSGPPTRIGLIGWSPDPHVGGFAVALSGRRGRRPAVVTIMGDRVRAFSPSRHRADLSFAWAPIGHRFLLVASQTYHQRNGSIYVGNARTGELQRFRDVRGLLAGPFWGAAGSKFVYQTGNATWSFISARLSRGGCAEPVDCPDRYPVAVAPAPGFLLGWT